jgi:hypothetical protein
MSARPNDELSSHDQTPAERSPPTGWPTRWLRWWALWALFQSGWCGEQLVDYLHAHSTPAPNDEASPQHASDITASDS